MSMLSSYVYMWFAVFAVNLESHFHYYFYLIVEGFFLISIFIWFHTDFVEDGETESSKDLSVIRIRYFKTEFFYDLIPIIPFPIIFGEQSNTSKLFFLMKCLRILNGIKLFDIKRITEIYKEYESNARLVKIDDNPHL